MIILFLNFFINLFLQLSTSSLLFWKSKCILKQELISFPLSGYVFVNLVEFTYSFFCYSVLLLSIFWFNAFWPDFLTAWKVWTWDRVRNRKPVCTGLATYETNLTLIKIIDSHRLIKKRIDVHSLMEFWIV